MKKYLIFDMSNLLYRTYHANKRENEDILIGMCHHSGFMSMNYNYKKYKPDEIVAIFDDYSWRKTYTKPENGPITHKKYKGNRRQDLTEKEKRNLEVFDEHIVQFHDYLRDYTSIITMKRKFLECDDLVAGFVDSHSDDQHILISSDKDFIQLLDNENLQIIEPDKEKNRTLDEWDGDAKLFMFEKCIRGDNSDNVQSSYPRLRKTKIKEAYTDSFKKTNIMNHEFEIEYMNSEGNLETKKYKTEDLFKENILLMDLRNQPETIKSLINDEVKTAMSRKNDFDLVKFIKFCKKHQLERILEMKKDFIKMLSTTTRDDIFVY